MTADHDLHGTSTPPALFQSRKVPAAFTGSGTAPALYLLPSSGVPPTNNQAEQSLRPVVSMRKVIQGTRSQTGLENHSVLRSLFETAKRQGKKAHHFFLDLFTKDIAQAQAALYRNPLSRSDQRASLRC